jgi:hypothetical protein
MAEASTGGDGPVPSVTAEEQEALTRRRDSAGVPRDGPTIALALSGGGIRSATFCLGVLRGLAKNGVLHRFDYLSTVSGGGYVGAAFGRLFQDVANNTAKDVEVGLARDDTVLLWWLRTNGRFLLPSGAKDLFRAWVIQLRNFAITQVEVAIIAVIFACLVTLPHAAFVSFGISPNHLPHLASAWSWLLIVPTIISVLASYFYWIISDSPSGRITTLVSLIFTAALSYVLARSAATHDASDSAFTLWTISGVVALGPIAWIVIRIFSKVATDTHLLQYSSLLATSAAWVVAFLALGFLDSISWFFRYQMSSPVKPDALEALIFAACVGTLYFAFIRSTFPYAEAAAKRAGRVPWPLITELFGLVTAVLICLFWCTIIQDLVFPARSDFGTTTAIERWALIAFPVLIYALLQSRSIDDINISSLHLFFRSRIARVYVSVGNYTQVERRFPQSPLSARTLNVTDSVVRVTNTVKGDDVDLTAYTPHLFGGPIHLINGCINQTDDDRTGSYNADRKGVALTVSALGIEIGTLDPDSSALTRVNARTLATWLAISGPPNGTGMASTTQPGLGALLFLSGIRAGYWLRNPWHGRQGLAIASRYKTILREMFAQFPGLKSRSWYLSDGGHFDNTGVYPLLKRQPPLIVLVDASADPDYRFEDVENLVRKARIDYGASIEFINPRALKKLAGSSVADLFGTPNAMTNLPGTQHLLLARVAYASGQEGCLLIVKPRIPEVMPLDVAGYAEREPSFPQQESNRHFFTESQWESYCQLGSDLGSSLTRHIIDEANSWAWKADILATQSISLTGKERRESKFRKVASTVGTSIGIGAILTAGITIWQTYESKIRNDSTAQESSARILKPHLDKIDELETMVVNASAYDDAVGRRVNDALNDLSQLPSDDELRSRVSGLSSALANLCVRTSEPSDAFACAVALKTLVSPSGDRKGAWTDATIEYERWADPPQAGDPEPMIASPPKDSKLQ